MLTLAAFACHAFHMLEDTDRAEGCAADMRKARVKLASSRSSTKFRWTVRRARPPSARAAKRVSTPRYSDTIGGGAKRQETRRAAKSIEEQTENH